MKLLRAQFDSLRRPGTSLLLRRLTDLALWLSLPLSIWLAAGWIGLALHWQAEIDAACLREWLMLNPQRVRQVL